MSIANLLEPNRYDLYSHSLDTTTESLLIGFDDAPRIDIGNATTPVFINGSPYNTFPSEPTQVNKLAFFTGTNTSTLNDCNITVTGANNDLTFDPNTTIFCDNINAVGNDELYIGYTTDSILIGTDVATNAILIGHEGLTVAIAERTVTNTLFTSVVDRNGTSDPVSIGGTYANQVNIGRSGAQTNILSDSVTLSGTLGFVGSASSINAFYENVAMNVTGSGAIPPQIVASYSLQRISSNVSATIKWTAGTIAAIANSPLILTPVFPAEYIPLTNYFFDCYVRRDGVTHILGFCRLEGGTGILTVQPSTGPNFTIGDQIDFNTITFTYNIMF